MLKTPGWFPILILIFLFAGSIFSGCSGSGDSPESTAIQNENDLGTSSDDADADDEETTATCSDGIQNQDETGVDCGGSCDPCYSGTIYYVSNDGNDDNDGLSSGSDGAWQTIARVNDASLSPGDAVLFQRGGEWREQLVITWSGTESDYITFSAYGEGEKPRILGSELAEDWSAVTGTNDIWESATALDAPLNGHPSSIFFGHSDDTVTWGNVWDIEAVNDCGSDFDNLGEEYDWCWENDTVYVHAPEDPDERYTFVEVPQRRGAITMESHNPQEYIAIDGLELMFGTMYGYSDGWPMDYEVSGLTIKNCHVAYIGIRGGNSAMGLTIWHSDMLVRNNDIHDSGRRNISYNVYTDNGKNTPNLVFENVVFEGNTLHNGYHTTGFDISHGDAMSDTFSNFTFRNNYIWDDPDDDPTDAPNDFTSMGLYIYPGAGQFTDFKVYNNIFKHLKQKSLAIGGCVNLSIYNNTIYGTNPNIGSYRPMVSLSGDYTNLEFFNNIVHGTVDSDDFESRCVYISSGTTGITTINNNLYFQDDSDQIIHDSAYGSFQMNAWSSYKSATGWDADSPTPANPLFVDAEDHDFYLMGTSPAINAGVAVSDRDTDYYGNSITGTPDIGAVEYAD